MTPTRRRAVLCVPASDVSKIAKAFASPADEVVVDLEDAVALDAKERARHVVAALAPRQRGSLAVRVNAPGTRWYDDDLEACAHNNAVGSVVIPKVDGPAQVRATVARLAEFEQSSGRRPVAVQALIESPAGLSDVTAIAGASSRLVSLIIGYADLSASLGRHPDASWQFVRDLVQLAARTANIQAIDGPHLTIRNDASFVKAVAAASALGFDGKWVIHPRQVARVQQGFSPSAEEVEDATQILRVMEEAAAAGIGAVSWRGRMLDEALGAAARRVIARAADA